MRNFKKLLSLVLCMAVMLSVMVVGAGAAFSDQSKIKNTEAVDMCVALNIINGYTDGSYKPEGNVTRAEMCKMICIALNGGKEPATATKATPTYTDIKGHWAEGYIEYCNTKGIVAGVGGGKFNPAGNVTGSQAAKMLLVALGYNADVERYTGESWELYVNVQANQDGLYTDLESMDPSVALTRDNAAQMIWNALQAYVINKTSSIDREDGSITDMYSKDTRVDLLQKMYDGEIKEAELTNFDYNSNKNEWTYIVGGVQVKSSTDYTALLGQNVKAVYDNSGSAAVKPAYGIFAVDSAVLLSGLVGNLPDLKVSDTSFKVDGVTYKLDQRVDRTPVYEFTKVSQSAFAAPMLDDLAGAVVTAYDALSFTAVDMDGNGKIDFVTVLPFQVAKVTYVSSTKFKLSAPVAAEFEFDNVNAYDGLKKDDYVVYTAAANSATEKASFVKADVISGEVTRVSGDDITVDGTVYTVDNGYGLIPGFASKTNVTVAGAKLTTAVVVNGYVFHVDNAQSTTVGDFAVVVGTESGGVSGNRAKLLFSNGDKTVVDTDKNYNAGVNAIANGTMVVYSKNSDGEYILTVADATVHGTNFDLHKDTAATTQVTNISNGSSKAGYVGGAYVDDDAVIFINYDGTSYKVITGAQMKKMNVGDFDNTFAGYLLGTKSGGSFYVDMAYVSIGANKINDADTYYGYVTAVADIQNADKETVKSVTVWTADGEKTFETASDNITGIRNIAKRNAIEYKLNADNEISEVVNGWDVDGTAAAAFGTDSAATVAITSLAPTLKVQLPGSTTVLSALKDAPGAYNNGKDFMDLDSDTVYLFIENTDAKGMEKVDIAIADDATVADTRVPNALIVVDKDGDVVLVVYDVDNDIAQ